MEERSATVKRKVKGPRPSTSKHRANLHRRPPPLPPKPTASTHPAQGTNGSLPIKTLQGVRTRRTDSTKDGWERDVVFVTRNTPLGALMGRCRSLIMDEGYTRIRLHALAAAIPHAILLLHALLDILPYPRGDKGMWYEIRTGSTECVDEVRPGPSKKGKEKAISAGVSGDGDGDITMASRDKDEDDLDLALEGIGAVEEDEPEKRVRLKSSIEIDLHIGPKRSKPLPEGVQTARTDTKSRDADQSAISKRNRPSKRKREVIRRSHAGKEVKADEVEEEDEEAAMNEMNGNSSAKSGRQGNSSRPAEKGQSKQKAVRASAPDSEDEEEEELENR